MKKVSVVIPVYNTESYLQSCIDGCMEQTLADIEFIFVNDASTDKSLMILRENEKRYAPRMKVIDSPVNLHVGGARNLGLAAAAGEYIGFVDSDDIPLPEMYGLLYAKAIETDADVCYIHSSRINEETTYDEIKQKSTKDLKPDIIWPERTLRMSDREMTDLDREWYMVRSPGHVWNALWKRSLLTRADTVFPEHVAYEDNCWAGIVEAYVQRIAFVQDIGYLYRVNPLSITQARNKRSFFDRITVREKLLETAKSRGLLDRLFSAYEYLYAYRDTLTTFRILATKFDTPDYVTMDRLIQELKRTFPNWYRNKYYNQLIPKRTRIENRCISLLPGICGRILHFLSERRK